MKKTGTGHWPLVGIAYICKQNAMFDRMTLGRTRQSVCLAARRRNEGSRASASPPEGEMKEAERLPRRPKAR